MLAGFFYGQKKLSFILFSYIVPIRKDNIYMKQSITRFDFVDWFFNAVPKYQFNFSREGLDSLFDYFEQLEEDMGKEIDFDPIAICCEYSEYENFNEIKENYSSVEINNIDDLRYHTSVIEIDDSDKLIIQDF